MTDEVTCNNCGFEGVVEADECPECGMATLRWTDEEPAA
jgi:predicted RNA-binding Zn-ribbon protein involved in translation (DUF1610 family)